MAGMMQPPRIVRWLRSLWSRTERPAGWQLSLRIALAVYDHDPRLAITAPLGSDSLATWAEWLERHFPTGEWKQIRNLTKADEIVRAYPRKKAGK